MNIGITQGDVNGVGLEVVIKALQDMDSIENLTPVIYGSPKAAAYHRKALNVAQFSLNNINAPEEAHPKRVNIITCGDDNIKVEVGKSAEAAGKAAFDALDIAVRDLCDGKLDAVVTAPVNKRNIQGETFAFPGQTEYLEQAAQAQALMMFVHENLRIGVVAGNVPLSKVSSCMTTDRVLSKLRILARTLKQDFSIDGPRIAVLSLNPHVGDQGLLGDEEEKVIAPAIAKAQEEGICAMGPYSADGIFGSSALNRFDAILAMYHDQAVAPFRAISLGHGAAFTAGLPFVRTAPVHGVGYGIAGKDIADCASMRDAIFLAMDVVRNRNQNIAIEAGRMTTVAEGRRERNA